ncbi:MAG: hypothetical protein R3290_04635 [Acidimicrobiia bacterium]|nr:hypothetical protein [Acidimicrobiia bacterium]
MDFSKLSNGAKIAGGAAVVLIINIFLPWYSISLGPVGSASINAFDAGFLAWGGTLVAVAGAVILVLKSMGTQDVKAGNFAAEQLAVILGAVGTVLILLRLITETNFLSFGVFLGLVAAAAVTYGSFMAMREAGLDLSADDFTGGGGD